MNTETITPTLFDYAANPLRFNGAVYSKEHDDLRLTGQILRIFDLMKDGLFRTLSEISSATGDPETSCSAQIRHLRKERFGSHRVDKRSRGKRSNGLWEYSLIVNKGIQG